jgi:hypothetical protein
VLYAIATGVSPFRAESPAASIRRVRDENPLSVSHVDPARPVWLAEIVAKLLAKRPADRFPSATEVAELFERRLAKTRRGARDAKSAFGLTQVIGAIFAVASYLAVLFAVVAFLLSRNVAASSDSPTAASAQDRDDSGAKANPFRRALAESRVSLSPPYEPPYPDAPTDRLSAQYAAQAICRQAGVPFRVHRSRELTDSSRRRWTKPDFVSLPADEALTRILSPLGVTFDADDEGVFLVPLASDSPR